MAGLLAERAFAEAISSAVVADFASAPILEEAVASGVIGPRKLRDMMLRAVESEVSGRAVVPLFPNLRKLAREQIRLESGIRPFGMGAPAPVAETDYSWIGFAAGAFTSVANAVVSYQTGKKLVGLEEERTAAYVRLQETLAKRAELDATAARLSYSKQAEEEAKAGPLSVAGIPGGIVAAGAVAAVVGGALLLKG
jgi:hypothetical protein